MYSTQIEKGRKQSIKICSRVKKKYSIKMATFMAMIATVNEKELRKRHNKSKMVLVKMRHKKLNLKRTIKDRVMMQKLAKIANLLHKTNRSSIMNSFTS